MAQDLALERPELGRRVQANFLGQAAPEGVVGPYGIDGAAGGGQRPHEQLHRPLAQRLYDDERLGSRQRVERPAQAEKRFRSGFGRFHPQPVQPDGRRLQRRMVGHIEKGPVPPQREGGVPCVEGGLGLTGPACLVDEPFEPGGIEAIRGGEAVAGRRGLDRGRSAEAVPETGDVGLQGVVRVGGQALTPQGVHQLVGAHHVAGFGQQARQQ